MITWFQIGLTCGPVGDYLVDEDAFLFYTDGDNNDFQQFRAGYIAAGDI